MAVSAGNNAHEQAVRLLLDGARLSQDEVASRLDLALVPAYWQMLMPSFSIDGDGPREVIETETMDDTRLDQTLGGMAEDGYFQTEPILAEHTILRMRECVEVLRHAHWPPVFTFVYDEFWRVTRGPALVRLLSGVLGPRYRQIPKIWTFHVARGRGGGGWPPHRDGRNRPRRLTIWIPLTDATLENGCMYVIPKRLIPPGITESFARTKAIDTSDMLALLQASRALPARAGSVLGWDFEVIHWGSKTSGRGECRVSVVFEFIGESEEPGSDELPLLDAQSHLPAFSERLKAIARAIRSYEPYEPLMIRYRELARRLAAAA
jgi:hypothetical protein